MAENGPFVCVIEQDICNIKYQSSSLVAGIRELRRDLARCRSCPKYKGCEQLKSFKEIVNQALEEIYQEWGIIKD